MRRKTVRVSWVQMAEWIAGNDNPDDMEVNSVAESIIVHMAAELTGRTEREVAEVIVTQREIWADGRSHLVSHCHEARP